MAFDHDDTDGLYERAIQPVLKSNGIIPIIINRREDNRDINHQIIEQLNACDFCITDLTYARPSVYFEAGYAQGVSEVIYTVRSDHLRKNQPDNLRVHFDLQMKPLIKWTSPEDQSFPIRLERRIRATALRKYKESQKEKKKQQQQRDDFAHMPLMKRLIKLRRRAVSAVKKLGFSDWYPVIKPYNRSLGTDPFFAKKAQPQWGITPWLVSKRREKKLLHLASVRVEESLTLTKLRDEFGYQFVSRVYPPHLNRYEMIEERSPVDQTIEHHFLISIKSVPQSRIMSAIPSLQWDPTNSRYILETDWEHKGTRWETREKKMYSISVELSVLRILYVYFIDNIQSFPEFQSCLNNILQQMGAKQ